MSIRSIGEIYWKQPQYSDEKLDVSDENSDIYRIFEVARNNINGLNLPDLLTLSMYLEGKLPLPKKKDRYASDIKPDYTPSHKKLHKFGESRLLLKCRARINELEKCDDVKLEGDYIRGTRARRDLDIEGGELKPGGSARDIVLNRGKPRTPAALRHVGAQQLINTNSITLPYKGHPNRKVELQKLADVFSANLRHAVTSNNVGMVKTLQAKMRGKLMIDDDFPEMTRLVVSKNAVECEFSIKLLINTLEQEKYIVRENEGNYEVFKGDEKVGKILVFYKSVDKKTKSKDKRRAWQVEDQNVIKDDDSQKPTKVSVISGYTIVTKNEGKEQFAKLVVDANRFEIILKDKDMTCRMAQRLLDSEKNDTPAVNRLRTIVETKAKGAGKLSKRLHRLLTSDIEIAKLIMDDIEDYEAINAQKRHSKIIQNKRNKKMYENRNDGKNTPAPSSVTNEEQDEFSHKRRAYIIEETLSSLTSTNNGDDFNECISKIKVLTQKGMGSLEAVLQRAIPNSYLFQEPSPRKQPGLVAKILRYLMETADAKAKDGVDIMKLKDRILIKGEHKYVDAGYIVKPKNSDSQHGYVDNIHLAQAMQKLCTSGISIINNARNILENADSVDPKWKPQIQKLRDIMDYEPEEKRKNNRLCQRIKVVLLDEKDMFMLFAQYICAKKTDIAN